MDPAEVGGGPIVLVPDPPSLRRSRSAFVRAMVSITLWGIDSAQKTTSMLLLVILNEKPRKMIASNDDERAGDFAETPSLGS